MTESNQWAADSPRSKTDEVRNVAARTGERVGDVAATAKDEAGAVKDTAAGAASDVLETAKQQGGNVVAEAKYQTRRLMDEGVSELRVQAGAGQERVAGFVRSLSGELQSMAQGTDESGPMVDLVNRAQRFGSETADWLERSSPDEVVSSVRRYAARNPWTFLAIAAGVGFVGARVVRGLQGASRDDQTATASARRSEPLAPSSPQYGAPAYGDSSSGVGHARDQSTYGQSIAPEGGVQPPVGEPRSLMETESPDAGQPIVPETPRTDPWTQGMR